MPSQAQQPIITAAPPRATRSTCLGHCWQGRHCTCTPEAAERTATLQQRNTLHLVRVSTRAQAAQASARPAAATAEPTPRPGAAAPQPQAEPPRVDARVRALYWAWLFTTLAVACASLLAGYAGTLLGLL